MAAGPQRSSPSPPPPMPPGRRHRDDQPERWVEDSGSKRPEEDQQTATPNPGPSPAQHTEENQPAPQQTPTPSPGPSPALDLQLAQRCEVPDILEELELNTTPSLSSCVSSLTPTGLLIKYFVRVDKGGFFHIYPDRGGPFKSVQEAQQAIDSYHVVGRSNLCMDGLSSLERSVRYALHWPHDGTRRNSAEAFAAMTTRRPVREVVKALLDKYNEDNGRLGDLAYELEEIVRYKPCFDGKGCAYRSYSHLNMTMKTKGADDPRNKLYFAEVTCMRDEHEGYLLTCICTVEPDDNGECLVCGEEMKHPSDAEYKHGRPSLHFRCCSYADADALYDEIVRVRDEAWLKEEEARVRRMFKESHEAIEMERAQKGYGHGKSAKYVIPAKRK